jgi:DNA-binding response OmpR family regulator
MGKQHTILVVDDEATVREVVHKYLEREGFRVIEAETGPLALHLLHQEQPDLVVLDLMLPGLDGFTIARSLRDPAGSQFVSAEGNVPIIMLTARTDEVDRITGFELGTDDYVTKPFSPRELVLRVRAILRRAPQLREPDGRHAFGDGELVIDEDRHEVRIRGSLVDLTATEWGLLLALATTPGRVHSRYELINRVRGYEFEGYERTVDSHVKNLRRKLERDPRAPRIIETVVGGGYRLGLHGDG